jgi:uncharacterized protein (UPF0548 family)
MALRLRRTPPRDIERLLAACREDTPTYQPQGVSLGATVATVPEGLERNHWECELAGGDAFARAGDALRAWRVHRGAGLELHTNGPLAEGTNVVIVAPLPVGFVEATCRIVRVVDQPDRFGFAYGTLSVHPERGEESFVVSRRPDGSATFDVVAVSAPAHPLARLVPPIAGRLQDRAARRYLAAMRAAVTEEPG